jgi:hypothetical protein
MLSALFISTWGHSAMDTKRFIKVLCSLEERISIFE